MLARDHGRHPAVRARHARRAQAVRDGRRGEVAAVALLEQPIEDLDVLALAVRRARRLAVLLRELQRGDFGVRARGQVRARLFRERFGQGCHLVLVLLFLDILKI